MNDTTVYFFMADGFEETELIAPVDILRRGKINVRLVSTAEDSLYVTGSHNITVKADILLEDARKEIDNMMKTEDTDKQLFIPVLPGGLRGTEGLTANGTVEKIVATAAEHGYYVGAICAAPSALCKYKSAKGEPNLIDGMEVSCYPGIEVENATVTGSKVTVCDWLITGEAMGAAVDFGLTLVKHILGQDEAEKIKMDIRYL